MCPADPLFTLSKELPMRSLIPTLAMAAFALTLCACSGCGNRNEKEPDPPPKSDPSPKSDPAANLMGKWRLVRAGGQPPAEWWIESLEIDLAADGKWTSTTVGQASLQGMTVKGGGTWSLAVGTLSITRDGPGNPKGTETLKSQVRLQSGRLVVDPDHFIQAGKEGRTGASEYERFSPGVPPVHVPLGGLAKQPGLKYMQVDLGASVKMDLVWIEPGKFLMGSPKEDRDPDKKLRVHDDELPPHEVEITKGFYMGVFEVTQEEYQTVAGKMPLTVNTTNKKGKRNPVDGITWEKAMEFCQQLGKKAGKTIDLPTEAEWEYACRAGSKGPYHYGDSLSKKQANFIEGNVVRVGSYEPNAFGLYDMHGNVAEWCKDWYKNDYYKESPLRDPQGPATGKERVLRGGFCFVSAFECRSAWREHHEPGFSEGAAGFRVVLRLP
jgi:formylglycine-generating enzyme required for sulfatase activity